MAKARSELTQSAFSINGVWLEDVVPGYHTINTANRYLIEKQLTLRESDKADGSVLTRSRYPMREIEVEYFIEGDTWEDFQTSYLILMGKLNVQNATIIFNGEPDKYVIGTLVAPDDIEYFQFSRSGTYKIVCADPFKYSVNEYVAAAVSNQWSLTYDGTYKTHPTFVFEFPKTLDANGDNTATSECGYVGLATQTGAMLQIGDPEEKDWGDLTAPAVKPIDKTFSSLGSGAKIWTKNAGETIGTNYVIDNNADIGFNTTDKYAYPSAYGSGTAFHGPTLEKTFTNASYKNWKFSFKQAFGDNTNAVKNQFGCFLALIYNNNGGTRTLLAGLELRKLDKNKNAKVYWYANGNKTAQNEKKGVSVACKSIGTSAITKQDETISFNCGGKTATFQLSSENAEKLANEVVFFFGQKKTSAVMAKNFLYSARVELFSYIYYGNVENAFMPGDILTVDTQNAEIFLDGGDSTTPANNLGALGNDWEDFVLVPGLNLIQAEYSDFTTVPPDAIMKYRKVYL